MELSTVSPAVHMMSARTLSILSRYMRAALADPVRRLQLSLLILLGLILVGTVGFLWLQPDMNLVEAFYMTIITLSTVGFGEVEALTPRSRIFAAGLIVLGIGTATWALGNAVEIVLGQTLWLSVQRRKMEELLMRLEQHYIVCGYGRIGQQIVRDLRARHQACVVVDLSPEFEPVLTDEQIPYVVGDATQDEVLQQAGIDRARGLVAALSDDASNMLAVVTARGLNPKLLIAARATTETAQRKLQRVGADRVISPYAIGGHRLTLALLRPVVHDFLNHLFDDKEALDLDIGQVTVHPGSPLAGQTLASCEIERIDHLRVIAIHTPQGTFMINPSGQHHIQTGETLILIGPASAIYQLEAQHKTDPADAQ